MPRAKNKDWQVGESVLHRVGPFQRWEWFYITRVGTMTATLLPHPDSKWNGAIPPSCERVSFSELVRAPVNDYMLQGMPDVLGHYFASRAEQAEITAMHQQKGGDTLHNES
jgi:hypothetical protein